jgi:DNA adenine methylase
MISYTPLVPPLKCQGIKTKLAGEIRRIALPIEFERWVEPFCGSAVVAFNVQPKQALMCDSNVHIIQFYRDLQAHRLTPGTVREFLFEHGEELRQRGEDYYYTMRDRFNQSPDSLTFLFLNRSCFNGVMRFNRSGKFNVPYCHKPERFAPAYITKIANQVRRIGEVVAQSNWTFEVADFRATLGKLKATDFVYADPPYLGRHVDYFNSWSEGDDAALAELLRASPAKFIVSTWHSNEFRSNEMIAKHWSDPSFHLFTRAHFYHVGSTESLRHPMLEALITNFGARPSTPAPDAAEQLAFFEQPPAFTAATL